MAAIFSRERWVNPEMGMGNEGDENQSYTM